MIDRNNDGKIDTFEYMEYLNVTGQLDEPPYSNRKSTPKLKKQSPQSTTDDVACGCAILIFASIAVFVGLCLVIGLLTGDCFG